MKLQTHIENGIVYVTGETYSFNQLIPFKQIGFRWDAQNRVWCKDADGFTSDQWLHYLYSCYLAQRWLDWRYVIPQKPSYKYTTQEGIPFQLMPHQIEAVEHIVSAYLSGRRGFLLADAPRVGKTYAALESARIISTHMGGAQVLVLSPASVVGMWAEHVARCGLDGWRVMSYEKFRNEFYRNKKQFANYQVIVLDEAHKVKNKSAKITKAIFSLKKMNKSNFVIALTGTPFQNNPSELKTLIQVIGGDDSLVEPFTKLKDDRYRGKVLVWNGSLKGLRLLLANSGFYLRREIADISDNLAPLYRNVIVAETERWNEIIGEIRTELSLLYSEYIQQQKYKKAKAIERLLAGIVKGDDLQLLAGDLAKIRRILGEAKAKYSASYIVDIIKSTNEPILIFTHHESVRNYIKETLDSQRIRYAVIDGSTPKPKRTLIQAQFQYGEVKVLLLSTRAAGEGLTLSSAVRSVFVELDWNPAVLLQAENRMVDMNRSKGKIADYIIAPHPIEQFLLNAINSKSDAIEQVYANESAKIVTYES